MHDAAMLAELIAANQPCVALTGAGVSAESGIPDFRSAGGIWSQFDPYEVGSIDAFHRDPERVWEFYALRLGVLADGWTAHATVDAATMRPTRVPAWLIEAIASAEAQTPSSSSSS